MTITKKPRKADFVLDCSGHLCPVPILMTEEKMADLKKGETLEVIFTDPGAKSDLLAWCKATGHTLLGFRNEKFTGFAVILKN
jgi:TusA-related sulfurtransferase